MRFSTDSNEARFENGIRYVYHAYAPADLARWKTTIAEQSWKDAFVFMKHEDAGTGPRLAAELSALFQAADRAG